MTPFDLITLARIGANSMYDFWHYCFNECRHEDPVTAYSCIEKMAHYRDVSDELNALLPDEVSISHMVNTHAETESVFRRF